MYNYDPPTQEIPVVKQRKRWPWVLGIIVALTIGVGVGVNSDPAQVDDRSPSVPSSPAAADVPVDDAEPVAPAPTDFEVNLKVTSKECFGSAGCLVTFVIDPVYLGDTSTLEGQWTVTYEIEGTQDGPYINSFDLDGDSVYYDKEEMVQTPSSSSKLAAEVTDVF